MSARIRSSPVVLQPGSNCWPEANCPLSPAGKWAGALGSSDLSGGTALAIMAGVVLFAVWARWPGK